MLASLVACLAYALVMPCTASSSPPINDELRDPPYGSPSPGVVPAPPNNQLEDSTRLQLQDGYATGFVEYLHSSGVQSVVVTSFFNAQTSNEALEVSTSQTTIASLKSEDLLNIESSARAASSDCYEQRVRTFDVSVCLKDDWARVTMSVTFSACEPSVRVVLKGPRSTSNANLKMSVGKVFIPSSPKACSRSGFSAISTTGRIVAIIVVVIALLVVSLCAWWCCIVRRRSLYPPDWDHGQEMMPPNTTHPQPIYNPMHGHPHPQQQVPSQPYSLPEYGLQSTPSTAHFHNVQFPTQQFVQQQLPNGGRLATMPVRHVALSSEVRPEQQRSSTPKRPSTLPAVSPHRPILDPVPQTRPAPSPIKPEFLCSQDPQEEDEEQDDPVPPETDTCLDQEGDAKDKETVTQIHLKTAAGITEMIHHVKDNLKNQRTLTREVKPNKHQLEVYAKIGGGGFGEVFKGKLDGNDVAVKIMKIKPGSAQESLTELPYTEAAIARICIHPNIVQTMYSDMMPVFENAEQQSFWSKAKDERQKLAAGSPNKDSVKEWQVRMVMEMCDLGSVRDWVSNAAGQRYGAFYSAVPKKAGCSGCPRTLCALLTSLDVANGMKLLHKYKILHSDLKPHNVLLVSSKKDPRGFIAKLSDFGLSMKMAVHDGQVPDIKYGTVQYLAPEVLSTHIMTKKADVYSFGIIMWEVWHSRLFAEFYNTEKKKRKDQGRLMDDYRPPVSHRCPKPFVRLMTACLDKSPEKRPDFLGGEYNICAELERLVYEDQHNSSVPSPPSFL